MRKKILIAIFFLSAIFLLTQVSSANVQPEKCKSCHGAVKPLEILTKNCLACHETHGSAPGCCMPETRDPEAVHKRHQNVVEGKTEKGRCTQCHNSPVECTRCHNTHEIVGNSTLDVSMCTNCHGALPEPRGHGDFRGSLLKSKHKWMNCKTCHLFPAGDIELHFKDLFKVQINDSINLCRICHSLQYEGLKDGTHGALDKTCVDCHNPHTTGSSGAKFQAAAPKETTPVNISGTLDLTAAWITTKAPILKNTNALFVFFIIMVVTLSEYLLSRHDEGKKVAYNMVKIQAGEETLKTLELKLKDQNMTLINEVLTKHNINILGMTMTNEKNKENPSSSIYKYVIFIDTAKLTINEKDLIDMFSSISEVMSVSFTDKYEL